MKVVLVFPPKTRWAFSKIKLHKSIDMEAGFYPPLGILYVASYLLRYSDHEVKIIDAVAQNLNYPAIENQIKELQPDVVGIYCCTEYLYDFILTAKLIKNISKEIVIVAGGPHTYFYPKETINIPEVDYVVCGEGERVFTELVNNLRNHDKIEKMPSVLTKEKKDKTVYRDPDIETLPFPARKLLPIKIYKSILAKRNPITTMITSRGCPYNCHFCNSIERNKRVRYRSAKDVIKEITSIIELGVYDIFFFDEMFTSNKKRVIEICERILAEGLKFRWHCRCRADSLDEQMIKKMKQAGCRLIQFGIEAGTERIQKILNKNLNLKKVEETIKMVRRNGILTYANFMFGSPTETWEEMEQTFNFAKYLKLDYPVFGVLNPLPETEIYTMGLREKKIKFDYWKEYIKHPEIGISQYWWPDFPQKKLEEINLKAFRKYYFRISYLIERILKMDSIPQALWQLKSALKIFL